MGFILYPILFILLLVLLVGMGIIRTIFTLLFGGFRRNNPTTQQQGGNNQQQQRPNNGSSRSSNSRWQQSEKPHKVFDKSDGEYVEFEEVKED